MITRKLVVVLGAGASKPFGFPTGYELVKEINTMLKPSRTGTILSDLVKEQNGPTHVENFRIALEKSGKPSVDAFLEHRPEFLDVGKLAIAWALLPRENEERLFSNGPNWYEYLFNKLNARFEEFNQNSLSILTFNYDRSLEHYLFTALKNAYGKQPAECAKMLHSIRIIHLYGQLGELSYLNPPGVDFGAGVTADTLRKCADGIQIIHEDDAIDKPQFQQAHELLRNAERICFLGFGYDKTNLKRLMAHDTKSDQSILGSAIGFSQTECNLIKRDFINLGFNHWTIELDNTCEDSLEFLRKYCAFD